MRPESLGLKAVRVHFGMFDYGFTCVIGPAANVPRYVAWKLNWPTVDAETLPSEFGRGRFYHRRDYEPIIWLPRWPKSPREYATLTHEVAHVVTAMFDWAGQPINRTCDEAFCHALGYAVAKVLEAKP